LKPAAAAALLVAVCRIAAGSTALAEIALPGILGSHMVLQRDMPVPIWGTAGKGETISVRFRDQEKTAVAEPDGRWMLRLDPLAAGGPDALTIEGSSSKPVALDDVLVGEVWLGSGQSNMDTTPKSSRAEAEKLGQPPDPRLMRDIEQSYPRLRLFRHNASTKGMPTWRPSTPETNRNSSALLFEFGIQLQAELDVPVGLVMGAEGGTHTFVWIPRDAFLKDASIQAILAKGASAFETKRRQAQEELDRWKSSEAAALPGAKPPVRVPVHPNEQPAVGQNYRRFIRVHAPFAIRGVLWDQGESGSGIDGIDVHTMMGPLIAAWRADWEQGEFPWIYMQKPSGWGCPLDSADPLTERAVPFAPLPPRLPWGYDGGGRRVMFARIREYPNTAMACVSDLGVGLHPLDKTAYATRAVRVAMRAAYSAPVEIYGPEFRSMDLLENGRIRVHFKGVGPGLAVPAGRPLQGFAIAGEDRVWRWAEALIEGDTVVVWNQSVPKPVAVRYGWAERMPWATLFSGNGLPALTFRTDDWEERPPVKDRQ